MLDTARDDEHLAGTELHVAVAELDRQPPAENEEEVIRVVMLVPHEFAQNLDDHELVVVQVADDARAVGTLEQPNLLFQIHFLTHTDSLP